MSAVHWPRPKRSGSVCWSFLRSVKSAGASCSRIQVSLFSLIKDQSKSQTTIVGPSCVRALSNCFDAPAQRDSQDIASKERAAGIQCQEQTIANGASGTYGSNVHE